MTITLSQGLVGNLSAYLMQASWIGAMQTFRMGSHGEDTCPAFCKILLSHRWYLEHADPVRSY